MKNTANRIIVIALLIVITIAVIIVKNRQKDIKPINEISEVKTDSNLKIDTNITTNDSMNNDTIQSQVSKIDTIKEQFKPKELTKQKQEIIEKNPLEIMLKNNKPTVLDLGSSTCIPCKMMKPIIEELEKEYKDRANILLLDIYEHEDLAKKYQVRVIPTQIFFDKDGNQYWRHEGFLAKEEIIKKLKELGVK